MKCPLCGNEMLERHRYYSPIMDNSKPRIYALKWTCSQSNGGGDSHYLEICKPTPKELTNE